MKKWKCDLLGTYLKRLWNDDLVNRKNENNDCSPILKQTLVALAPLLLTVCSGMTSGYSAILLPQLKTNSSININDEEASWIASMAALPMAIGSLAGGYLVEKTGRRATHAISCMPTLIGWLLIYFASNIHMILAGRFVTGFCVGLLGSATGVYIGETSEPAYRGFLLAGISFSIAFGLFLSHLLGTFLHWRTTALISSLLPIASQLILLFVPESPSFLAKKQDHEKAEESFYWCRGRTEQAKTELAIMLERQKQQVPTSEATSIRDRIDELLVPEFLKPLGIIVVFIVANQWAGINAITFYTVTIMEKTIGDGVNEYVAMLTVDTIRVLMSILACILLRRLGRRPLAIVSGIGTSLALISLSASIYLAKFYPNLTFGTYIPMTSLVAYIAFVSVGFVPLPWAMIGEVFPLKTRSVGSGISSFMAFTAFFTVVKTSPGMLAQLGTSGTFLTYSVVATVATVFVCLYLPETKGKALHEIEDKFKNSASKSADAEHDNQ